MSGKQTVQKPVMSLHLAPALDLEDFIILEYDRSIFPCSFSMRIRVIFSLRSHLEQGCKRILVKILDIACNLDICILYSLHFHRMLISQDSYFILLGKSTNDSL